MASFKNFLPTLLQEEGGYANNPADGGGETYRGIARNYNPSWSGWKTIDAQKHPIAHNTIFPELEDAVGAFYKANYWDPLKADNIKTQEIAEVLVDWKINGGLSISTVQTILVTLGQNITVDGEYGTQTLNALNKVNQQKLFTELINARKEHYDDIVANHPSQETFYAGWMNRLESFTMPKLSKRNIVIVFAISFVLLVGYAWYAGWLKEWFGYPKMKLA